MKIGFIGTGVMGSQMVRHLSQHHSITVFNRTVEKAKPLTPFAKVASTVEEVLIDQDVIMTMVGKPDDVKNVFEKMEALVRPTTIWIDLTTSSPALAVELSQRAIKKQIFVLDAPVTGGEKGAKEKTLTLMVGGDQTIFQKVRPLLELLGSNILYTGQAGSGQHTKIANQIAIAGALASLAESLSYASVQGLNLSQVLKVIQSGAANSYSATQYGHKMLTQDWLATFYLKHFLKDLTIAVSESPIALPIVNQVKAMLENLVVQYGEQGVQTIIKSYPFNPSTSVYTIK
jgi:3-hydroxyisobutyrate dehydrogenase-like beta-hydroxyacid dehydrogenase